MSLMLSVAVFRLFTKMLVEGETLAVLRCKVIQFRATGKVFLKIFYADLSGGTCWLSTQIFCVGAYFMDCKY